MPARNSARSTSRSKTGSQAFSVAHPFGCPTGDGGRCTVPQPPMAVDADGLRPLAADEEAALASRRIPPASLSVLPGIGTDALARAVDGTSPDGARRHVEGLVITCSCGHVLLAEDAAAR